MLAETAKHSERTPKSLDYSTFRLRSLTPHMGAEVLDLDLANPLDAQQSRDPDDAFRDWKVLVFRDQAIRRDQHKASWPCSSTTSPPTSPPRIHCRVQWAPHTVTLWDNRCTQHHAVWDYYPECRRGERVSVLSGVAPAGV